VRDVRLLADRTKLLKEEMWRWLALIWALTCANSAAFEQSGWPGWPESASMPRKSPWSKTNKRMAKSADDRPTSESLLTDWEGQRWTSLDADEDRVALSWSADDEYITFQVGNRTAAGERRWHLIRRGRRGAKLRMEVRNTSQCRSSDWNSERNR